MLENMLPEMNCHMVLQDIKKIRSTRLIQRANHLLKYNFRIIFELQELVLCSLLYHLILTTISQKIQSIIGRKRRIEYTVKTSLCSYNF